MSNKKSLGTDFTEGKVMPLLLAFFFPFLLANLLNSIYNTVDTIIIGQFVGKTGTVAVSLGGKLLNLYTNVSVALAGGGQILIAQLLGAKRKDEINKTVGTMLSEMIIISVVLAVITLLLADNILDWLNTPPEAYDSAFSYLIITSAGLPLIYGYNAVSSVLRGMGDSQRPLIFIAIAAVINLIGDIIFIIYFNLGATGTAIATVLGQGISLIFSLIHLYRRKDRFGFDFKLRSFAIDTTKLKIMLRVGLPMALRTCCIAITQLILFSYVNLYGLVDAAAYSIGDKIIHLTNIFDMSAKQAGGAMIGQNIGAEKYPRVKQILKDCFLITLSTGITMVIFSLIIPTQIFRLFTYDPDVLLLAPTFMRIACIIFILAAIMSPLDSIVTGTGNSMLGLIGGLLDGVIFRILFSYIFVNYFNLGVPGFFLGDALARLGPIIVDATYYLSGKWKTYKKLVNY